MAGIVRVDSGPRMSQAVVHNGVAHLAGQVARDSAGRGVRAEVEEICARIDALLQACGTDKTRLLTATVYLADMRCFEEMNRVWESWVAPGHAPTRVTIETRMTDPRYAVAIAATAT